MELPEGLRSEAVLTPHAEAAFARLVSDRPDLRDRLEAEPELARALAAVGAASRPLTDLLLRDPTAVDAVAVALVVPIDRSSFGPLPSDPDALVAAQQRSFLRIAVRDLVGLDDLVATTAALSDLASWTLDAAASLAGAHEIAVIGMGKLGAGELNYASDIDVVFAGEGAVEHCSRLARRIVEIAGRCYRVDTALRPEGRDGALVRSITSYESYWNRWAEPWEFQALLKAAPVAGNVELGEAFEAAASEALWARTFGSDELRSLRNMKARSEAEAERRGDAHRDLKLGPGGIRDVEFSVQLLQLVHAQSDLALRMRATLPALAELGRAGYVDHLDAEDLAAAYRFLRRAEHALQLEEGRQLHVLHEDPVRLDQLARVLGFRASADSSPGEQLETERRAQRAKVRSVHERLYFRPLLEAFSDTPGALTPVAAGARLSAFGFSDANRTRAAVRELTAGLNRTSRLMAQMLPLILDWLSTSPDPDQGLLGLRTLLADRARAPRVTEVFRESPEAARRLCILLGTSAWLGETVAHDPELVGALPVIGTLPTPSHQELTAAAERSIGWRRAAGDRQGGLRRWKDRQIVTVAVADLLDAAPVLLTGERLASVAEAVLEAALGALEPKVPFTVIAAGRLGAHELAYHSDLDLLFVHDSSGSADDDEALRVASGLLRFVGGPTPASRLYAVDPDLRPEGRQGPLSRSLSGFDAYWDRWAEPWERLAMVRARPVAGDVSLGRAWAERLAEHLWGSELSDEDLRRIRLVKARMENERIPAGEDPRFHLKLGKGGLADVELTVALAQLSSGVRAENTGAAIHALSSAGVLSGSDAGILQEAFEWCERVRSRWHLLRNGPGDSLPGDPDGLRRLARSLDTSASRLRDEYLRVTRRARAVVEREFYGS